MKKSAKTTKSKVKTKSHEAVNEVPAESLFHFRCRYALWLIYKLLTLPFYTLYLFLWKFPNEGPAKFIGFLRFVFFMWIASFYNHNELKHFVENFFLNHNLHSSLAIYTMGIISLILLPSIFVSFMVMCGACEGVYWYDPYEAESENSVSGFDAIEKGLDYREILLDAKHTPGKIEELKKTGFITKERLVELGSSPSVNKALSLLNSQMRAMHGPDKYKTLQEMFGGAKA